jgi:CheY-like chemotaxis protein
MISQDVPEDDRLIHTVLVLEDEDELRESMRDLLEDGGYVVVTARDGQEGLDALADIEHLCLVLLDLLMPRMNGWDFFEAMRARAGYAAVPVVVHSSASGRAPEGVTRVLTKPLQPERLLATVREFCVEQPTHA